MRVSVHDSVSEINADLWDGIVGSERLFQTHAWLRSLENDALIGCKPKYFVCWSDSGEILAHLNAYVIRTSLVLFSHQFLKRCVSFIQRLIPHFLEPKILECGCPLGPSTALSVRSDADVDHIVAQLCKALDKAARLERVRITVVRDFFDRELGFAHRFVSKGFFLMPNLPTMELNVRWRLYEEYFEGLRSRFRQKIQRGLRIARKSGLSAHVSNGFGAPLETFAHQRANVYENSKTKEYAREQISVKYYESLACFFPGRLRIIEIKEGSKLVAHALVILDGATVRWLSFGRDATSNFKDGAYFLAIDEIVRLAIAEKSATIDMGMTTHAPKTDFGAQMVPVWMVVHVRAPFVERISRFLLPRLNPVAQIQERRVFRH